MKKIAVFISGGGTDLQSLIDNVHEKSGEIRLVVSSRGDAYGLERAKIKGIETMVLPKGDYDSALLEELKKREVEWIVLAGFLKILSPELIRHYPRHIVNIHPSLIPAFSGPGFYGMRVHEAVYRAGVKWTGATVHFVSEVVDGGAILLQEVVPVLEADGPEEIAGKVLEVEHRILPATVKACLEDRVFWQGERAFIREEV
ncbi:phosphoribosylglycinamide formyltransferase [Oribacterium parvum ACB8]|uniref:phosphoribosylglycinamide formyltransferase n=1 Tax=Oribacterium parvum TaxID=1501329 RepID=UPI00026F0ABD|nr:phosphoribosylglycinamide formyltransferase [Oribacterium parvum]EJF13220.1 phosphoribosylglycinamide formyltransferase [Oribacterium parvum ACB8]MBF1268976.1 phosphoribosylglycinamide formyltransferase [Oribacterium parvum]